MFKIMMMVMLVMILMMVILVMIMMTMIVMKIVGRPTSVSQLEIFLLMMRKI